MRIVSLLLNVFRPGRAENEMNREIEAHLRLIADDFERRGMPPADARRAARLALGGVEQTREMHRESRTPVSIEQTLQDIRYAARGLARSPGFTVVAVLTLALGIGVNTALFTTFDAVALKPMPVRDPDRVVRFERWFESGSAGNIQYAFSLPEFNYCQEHGAALGKLVAASWQVSVKGAREGVRLVGQLVSPNYFEELGIPLLAGRGLASDAPAAQVIVVSDRYWRNALGADPAAIGRTVVLNRSAFTVIGITAKNFTGTSVNPAVPDFWAPLALESRLVAGADWSTRPDMHELQILARVPPGTPVKAARAQAEILIRQFDRTFAERDPTVAITLPHTSYFPNTDDIRFRAMAAGLMLLVGLILFVACVNVGNMVLARGASRQREIAARLALGAGRGRVVRQLLTESMLLSLLGGIAGLAASRWAAQLLAIALGANPGLIGGDMSAVDLTPDARVLFYNFALSIFSGVLFGLSPALQAARRGIASALKIDLGFSGVRRSRMRALLVGVQVAVSVLLLATAGLLARGMMRARNAEPGFDSRAIYVAAGGYGSFRNNPAAARTLMDGVLERLRILPEVKSIALGSVPFTGTWTAPVSVEKRVGSTLASYASAGYTDVIGLSVLRGRRILPEEATANAPVALVSEATARKFWPDADPIGRSFTLDLNFRGNLKTFGVIGVVNDIRFANLTRTDPEHVYLAGQGDFPGSILLRLKGDPRQAMAAVNNTLNRMSPEIQDAHLVNLDSGFVAGQRQLSRGLAGVAAALALLALMLAGVGIYGIVAYLVGQRTKEIGVRMALGARGPALLRGVVTQALRPVFCGIAVGLLLAAVLSAVLHQTLIFPGSMDLFYGIPFYDPLTLGGLLVFTALLTAVASLGPAWRALRVDPLVALRYE